MNVVVLIGNLTKQPELKYLPGSGTPVATFTLAVQRNFKNANGEYEADFINCKAWKGKAELIANNLNKGSKVCVHGSIQTGKYTAQDGSTRYTTEVNVAELQFLDKVQKNNEDCPQDEFKEIENMDGCPF